MADQKKKKSASSSDFVKAVPQFTSILSYQHGFKQ